MYRKIGDIVVKDSNKKLILVDDNPVVLKLARNALMDNYDIITVPSAEKLFQAMEIFVPDLILLDVLMPEMSGYEAIKILKSNPTTSNIPVIFLTSQNDPSHELEGLDLGAIDYIAKPFSSQLLQKRVDIHMLIQSQQKQLEDWNHNLSHMLDVKNSSVIELQYAVLTTMSNLVECRDDVTGGHIERTEHILRMLVEEVQKQEIYSELIDGWDLNLFFNSSKLHDVGKISIRDDILLKPAKLSDEEYDEMKKHTTFGETIIAKIQDMVGENMFLTHAKILAGTHHERWDGTGYPRGLCGSDIPLEGRLMAIADVYDALVSVRPYKEAFSSEDSLKIIKEESGKHFDPLLVDAFMHATL
jgi:putative two-component system response regulator